MPQTYTTQQLIELRALCADILMSAQDKHTKANAIKMLEFIDEELAMRQRTQAA